MTPGDRVAQLYSQALGTHFSRLLRHAWVTVGLFFPPVTTRTYGHDTYVQFGLTCVLHPEPLIATKMQTFYGSLCKINNI
jgi:hypothetical protein